MGKAPKYFVKVVSTAWKFTLFTVELNSLDLIKVLYFKESIEIIFERKKKSDFSVRLQQLFDLIESKCSYNQKNIILKEGHQWFRRPLAVQHHSCWQTDNTKMESSFPNMQLARFLNQNSLWFSNMSLSCPICCTMYLRQLLTTHTWDLPCFTIITGKLAAIRRQTSRDVPLLTYHSPQLTIPPVNRRIRFS